MYMYTGGPDGVHLAVLPPELHRALLRLRTFISTLK